MLNILPASVCFVCYRLKCCTPKRNGNLPKSGNAAIAGEITKFTNLTDVRIVEPVVAPNGIYNFSPAKSTLPLPRSSSQWLASRNAQLLGNQLTVFVGSCYTVSPGLRFLYSHKHIFGNIMVSDLSRRCMFNNDVLSCIDTCVTAVETTPAYIDTIGNVMQIYKRFSPLYRVKTPEEILAALSPAKK